MSDLPPSLAATPNIPLEAQTLDQLEAERAYWQNQVIKASGFASANTAWRFQQGCETWIRIRRAQQLAASDAAKHGVGVTLGGKHVPLRDFYKPTQDNEPQPDELAGGSSRP